MLLWQAALLQGASRCATHVVNHCLQTWLLPAEGTVTTEDELVQSQRNTKSCYLVEPSFDTSEAATVSANFTQEDRESLQPVVWRRVTGQLIVPTQHYCRLVKVCCMCPEDLGCAKQHA